MLYIFFFQAEDGIRDIGVTGDQTCALPISRGPIKVRSACCSRRNLRVRIASSAVTPGDSRQRPSLDSMRFSQNESRNPASPSGFERNAATILLSPACPGPDRDGALPWTSVNEGPAAGHPKEFSCRKNSLSARPPTTGESRFWKKASKSKPT